MRQVVHITAGMGFNPRLPGGRRPARAASMRDVTAFQSTPSGGKATARGKDIRARYEFQSTPSGGKATTLHRQQLLDVIVSIHAFRGEGDYTWQSFDGGRWVSIHAFRGEGDSIRREPLRQSVVFQSTPSGGKATAISRAAVPCSRQIL